MRVYPGFFLFGAATALAPSAHAYLDPNAGSVLLQLVLGGTAGLVVLGRLFWGRIRDSLKGWVRGPRG